MTKVIIIRGGSLESYYEQTLDYIEGKYHTYPENPNPVTSDPGTQSHLHTTERHAKSIAEDPGSYGADYIPGKSVI